MNKRGLAANISNEIKLSFPSLSVNEGIARSVVAVFAAQLNPTVDELADIKCAVSEAVTNCIVHAYRDSIGVISLNLRICSDDMLRIEIKDKGCGIPDIAAAREPLYTTDPEGERSGMGFAVMESFTDRMRVKSKVGSGTTVTLYKKLNGRK
ncbi:MAG: anti-sigma F factor [Clostridia bacterium]|nr:anti-sigma F factor [Clostridia bacterium]